MLPPASASRFLVEHISRQPAPGVKFIPLRPSGQKIRYGVAWRKEPSEPLVHRFIEYTKEQLGPSYHGPQNENAIESEGATESSEDSATSDP